MSPYLPIIIAAAPAAILLGRAVLRFDRRMVEAGKRRRLESETQATTQRAADGATTYTGQLEGEAAA
jgi:hypothetical protein